LAPVLEDNATFSFSTAYRQFYLFARIKQISTRKQSFLLICYLVFAKVL